MQQKQQLDGEKILKQTGREICNLHVEGKPQHRLRRPAESPLTQQQDIIPCNCWDVNKITFHVSPVLCLRFCPYHEGIGRAPSPLLALHLGTGSFKHLSPCSSLPQPQRSATRGCGRKLLSAVKAPDDTEKKMPSIFFFPFLLSVLPPISLCQSQARKKKKRTKRFKETKPTVMKNEQEDNSAWGVQTNYLEQIVYFKVLTNLLQRPVEKSQVPYSNPFPYL